MLNLPPQTTLDPINACIYCDAREPKERLIAEHVIPLSLGGTYVLPKASCARCAKETSKLELYAGRHIFQDVRIEHGLPTRRPKERPTQLPLRESFSPSPETAPIRLVPTRDYPGVLILINPEPAGILLGRPADQRGGGIPFVRQITGQERIDRLKEQGIPAKIYREIRPDRLLRLLAKMALGLGVATCGVGGFDATVRADILRHDTNPSHWVGGTTADMLEFPPPSGPNVMHRAVVFERHIGNVTYLVVQLQIFAYLGAPVYTVVVGILKEAGRRRLGREGDILRV